MEAGQILHLFQTLVLGAGSAVQMARENHNIKRRVRHPVSHRLHVKVNYGLFLYYLMEEVSMHGELTVPKYFIALLIAIILLVRNLACCLMYCNVDARQAHETVLVMIGVPVAVLWTVLLLNHRQILDRVPEAILTTVHVCARDVLILLTTGVYIFQAGYALVNWKKLFILDQLDYDYDLSFRQKARIV